MSGCVIVLEEWEKAEGTDETSVTHTLPSLLAGGFLVSRKTELHLIDFSILMTISVLLGLLWPRSKSRPGGGSRSKEQHEAVGGQPGAGSGWEGAEGVTGTPASTSGNTHTPPLAAILETAPFLPLLSVFLLSLCLAQKVLTGTNPL